MYFGSKSIIRVSPIGLDRVLFGRGSWVGSATFGEASGAGTPS
jgi:hypothetical protein